jgi:hypothetical protein
MIVDRFGPYQGQAIHDDVTSQESGQEGSGRASGVNDLQLLTI